jgi:putative addiction module killer protein/probable addiction module antidote protein
MVTIKVCFDNV